MRLKYQLLLLGLLSLLLPLTGWFALKSVDKEFRYSIEQTSKNTLGSLQASVQQIIKNNKEFNLSGLVIGKLDEVVVDGDDSEWLDIQDYTFTNQNNKLSVKLGLVANNITLFIQSNDKTKKQNTLNQNDSIIIGIADERGVYKYRITRQPEGNVSYQQTTKSQPRFKAYWHELAEGYSLEITFEINNVHHIGFASINTNEFGEEITGTPQANNNMTLMPIAGKTKELQQAITSITPINNYFVIKDKKGRVIYESNKLPIKQKPSSWQWIITPIYQWLFGIEKEDNWFYRQSDGMAGISQNLKAGELHFYLKSMMPQGQQSMIQSLLKSSILMIAVVFIIMFAYLLYSLILAWRIKKLNNAMQTVLDDSGKLHIQMPSHSAKDEIGELSRGIQTMLAEMREYTQYLKDIGSRLSHEMKTPLAIVQSSLDNLEMEQSPEFLQRAQIGTKRLRFILNQLSELSRLKYALEITPKEMFNLTELCQQLGKSYQSFIPQLKLEIDKEDHIINGSSDLIAQLIDKLIDNAKDFTPKNGEITLKLATCKSIIILSVINTGSKLPENLGNSIFDSLVSSRVKQTTNNNSHLGLGLYIVQLISNFHRAKLIVTSNESPKIVEFSIKIKK